MPKFNDPYSDLNQKCVHSFLDKTKLEEIDMLDKLIDSMS